MSYAVKFNWAHRWHGAVFQGRFKSVLIQEQSKAQEVGADRRLGLEQGGAAAGAGVGLSEPRSGIGEAPTGAVAGTSLEFLETE